MGAQTTATCIIFGFLILYLVEGIPLQTSFYVCRAIFGQKISDVCKDMVAAPVNTGFYTTSMEQIDQLDSPSIEKRAPNPILLDIPDYINRRKLMLKKLKSNIFDKNGYFSYLMDQGEE